jgi:hypothetical protein
MYKRFRASLFGAAIPVGNLSKIKFQNLFQGGEDEK